MVESFSRYIQLPASRNRIGSPITFSKGDIEIQGYIGFYDYGRYNGKKEAF